MGSGCSSLEAWTHVVTTEEVRNAVRSVEAWQKAQDTGKFPGVQPSITSGSLLSRLGGLDVVKQVVEAFYRKLYVDPKLIVYLHDKEMSYLRAKQSMFMAWLFGPPNVPYTGRNVRIAHLRIIKQRGFSPEDFDLGMKYFEEGMRELGAHEKLISEVMAKVLPFKDAIFTPTAREAEEEARWAIEDRNKELREQQLSQQMSSRGASQRALSHAASGARAAVPAASAPIAALSPGHVSPSASARGPQCPFTGGRLSRPASGAMPAGAAEGRVIASSHSVSMSKGQPAGTPSATGSANLPSRPTTAASASKLPAVPASEAEGSVVEPQSLPMTPLQLQRPASRASVAATPPTGPPAADAAASPRRSSSQAAAAAGSTDWPASASVCPYAARAISASGSAAGDCSSHAAAVPLTLKPYSLLVGESVRPGEDEAAKRPGPDAGSEAAPAGGDAAAADIVDAFLSEVAAEEAQVLTALRAGR